MEAQAIVATALPRRYMGQLCKHFQHRLPVTLGEDEGRIDFPDGVCRVTAEANGLRLHIKATGTEELVRLEDVVARHLVRFAFRDQLTVTWTVI